MRISFLLLFLFVLLSCLRDNKTNNESLVSSASEAQKEVQMAYDELVVLIGSPEVFRISQISSTTATYTDTVDVSFEYSFDAEPGKKFATDFVVVGEQLILLKHREEIITGVINS